jgi:hypothetical protein
MPHSWIAFDKARKIVEMLKEKYLPNLPRQDQMLLRGLIQIILEES